jgi:hypothetical protein
MKARRSREIELFSISALDLFASAMAAFLIISVILLPFYKRVQQLRIEQAALNEAIPEDLRRAAEHEELSRIEKEIEALEQAKKQEEATATELKAEVAQDKLTYRMSAMPIEANRLHLLLDGTALHGQHRDRMIRDLTDVIQRLTEEVEIAVSVYAGSGDADGIRHWPAAGAFVVAGPKERAAAVTFVREVPSLGPEGTPHLAALEQAMVGPPKTILVLSDGLGAPRYNDGLEPMALVDRVASGNKQRYVIHAGLISKDDPSTGPVLFFQALAFRNRGQMQVLSAREAPPKNARFAPERDRVKP